MTPPREFVWDPEKAAANVVARGISFEFATLAFHDLQGVDIDVSRDSDGEIRRKLIARIERRLFAVVYTLREGVCRVISARRTNKSEERLYGLGSLPS
jgi:uncharacterized DUF497 family protein